MTYFKEIKSALCVISYKRNGRIGGIRRAQIVSRTLNTQKCDFRNKLDKLVSGLCGRKKLNFLSQRYVPLFIL